MPGCKQPLACQRTLAVSVTPPWHASGDLWPGPLDAPCFLPCFSLNCWPGREVVLLPVLEYFEPFPMWTRDGSGKWAGCEVDQGCWAPSVFFRSGSQGCDALPASGCSECPCCPVPLWISVSPSARGWCCRVSAARAFRMGTLALRCKAFSLVLCPTPSSLLPLVAHGKHTSSSDP